MESHWDRLPAGLQDAIQGLAAKALFQESVCIELMRAAEHFYKESITDLEEETEVLETRMDVIGEVVESYRLPIMATSALNDVCDDLRKQYRWLGMEARCIHLELLDVQVQLVRMLCKQGRFKESRAVRMQQAPRTTRNPCSNNPHDLP